MFHISFYDERCSAPSFVSEHQRTPLTNWCVCRLCKQAFTVFFEGFWECPFESIVEAGGDVRWSGVSVPPTCCHLINAQFSCLSVCLSVCLQSSSLILKYPHLLFLQDLKFQIAMPIPDNFRWWFIQQSYNLFFNIPPPLPPVPLHSAAFLSFYKTWLNEELRTALLSTVQLVCQFNFQWKVASVLQLLPHSQPATTVNDTRILKKNKNNLKVESVAF